MRRNSVKIGVFILALLLVGGLVTYKLNPSLFTSINSKMSEPFSQNDEGQTKNVNSGTSESNSTKSNGDLKTPEINAPKPVNGTKKAIVELGSTGYNYFIINVDGNRNYEVLNKQFGMSYAKEDLTSYDEIKNQLKQYIYEITNKHGVATKNIHFVMSSGALKNPNIETIAKAIQSDKNRYIVNKVTADQEGKYAFNSLVLESYKNNSFYVDIGSGNTKISWYDNGVVKTRESFGAKYTQDGTKDTDVIASIRKIISEIPNNLKQNCFVIGGIPYKLASTDTKNGRYQYLRNDYNMNKFKDDKDFQRIKGGNLILNTIQSELNSTEFIFDHDANFSIGYLITLR